MFTELHARSAFSFLRGASSPEEMVTRAAELGMQSIALTDRDGVYGSARAHHKAKELGLRAITGCELRMECGCVLPVIVRTRRGYQNLCQMLTQAHLQAAKGESRVSWAALENFAEGLTVLTGDEDGVLSQNEPLEALECLKRVFGREHVFVEIHRHRVPRENERVRRCCDLALAAKLPLIASNAPLYARPEGRMLQDAFTALRHHTTLDEAGLRLAPNAERCLKSAAQMRELFHDLPEALKSTQHIVESVEFGLENLGYEFPQYPVPAEHSQDSFLRERTDIGARERYREITPEVRQQLDHELRLISKLGFSGYFLVVWDIVRWARQSGILVQGRGSAANSAVCYSLGITNVDPIAQRLLFERFLSEGRNTWPDIDLDLPSGTQRERVIQEVYRRFAPHGAAMTANVITYRGRSAMREMGKVLHLPQDVIERFSDLYANGDFPHTLQLDEQIRRAGLPQSHPRLPALIKLYNLAYGLPRHLGQHSGGMVLCTAGLDKIVPLEPASMPGRVVVQWDKDDCEDLGIIKVDLLGLGMMAAIEKTLEVSAARGRPVDLAQLPKDDPACFDLMQRADTVGVFQIESRAQMATLPRMKPTCFYDVVVEVAIIRPGPIVGRMVHPYLNRRNGKEPVDYIHPDFEPVLVRTLGVPLFQEQVLKMAMIIADFTGSEAEELRRAMSFHRSEERMTKALDKLTAAMSRKGVDPVIQDRIVKSIRSFALYGFPESHAISFALLAYASVWLKVHRAAEFYAALLNCQPMGFYSSATLVRDAKQHGLRLLPVCVAASDIECTVIDDTTLRLGLNQLKGVSHAALVQIIAERQKAPWRDLRDFLRRCTLAKDERRVLAQAGALNALGHHRRSALWDVEATLHDDLLSHLEDSHEAPLAMMSPQERLASDYATTTLTVGPHPMALVRPQIPKASSARVLTTLPHGRRVTIIGMVICRQRPGTANGHCFISLEDETGIANAFVPSDLFEKRRLTITQEPFLKITGKLQRADGTTTVLAQTITAWRYDETRRVSVKSHDFG
ncbi:DNA polymerase III subunit alpha [Prosthecobacter sp.]|jgi:error-prone DNA polymerase|uniref:DNA polymerase III subunit alpha n=1 Tax=Prosthecobacter sp. TaxID=1965333 RepID=UPI00378429B7